MVDHMIKSDNTAGQDNECSDIVSYFLHLHDKPETDILVPKWG